MLPYPGWRYRTDVGNVGRNVEMGVRESGVSLTEDAVEDLIDIVKDTEKVYSVRSQAISILGKINPASKDVIDVLMEVAETEKDHALQGNALYALSTIGTGSQRIADFLAKLMKKSDDREITQQAGSALAGIMLRRSRYLNFEADMLGLSMKMADAE